MFDRQEIIAELSCRVVDFLPPDKQPELVVILCHGFGAPGDDLVSIGSELILKDPQLAESVRFIFPAAPLSLDDQGMYGGRAWWYLDVAKLTRAIETGEMRDQRGIVPAGLPEASKLIQDLVRAVQSDTNLPLSRIVLGGFSQGSMVMTDVALRLDETPAALVVMSGTLLCEDIWRELANQRDGLRVLQSHGTVDPILPLDGALWLREMLQETGASVEYIEFPGVHTIPMEMMDRFAKLLTELADE